MFILVDKHKQFVIKWRNSGNKRRQLIVKRQRKSPPGARLRRIHIDKRLERVQRRPRLGDASPAQPHGRVLRQVDARQVLYQRHRSHHKHARQTCHLRSIR